MNKKELSERDICTKFITPAICSAGLDVDTQIREEVSFMDGRIYVRGKLHTRGARKRADYILYYKPNIEYFESPMAHCRKLENEIDRSRRLADLLFQAALKEAFSSVTQQRSVEQNGETN